MEFSRRIVCVTSPPLKFLFPVFEPIRWQVSEWRLLFAAPLLGKESLDHETSDNHAGLGRDDVELNRLLLLVAVERLRPAIKTVGSSTAESMASSCFPLAS